jgi:hypothetical protein
LADVGEVEIAVEGSGYPDAARLDAPVGEGSWRGEVGGAAAREVEPDVALEGGLVAFDDEVVVGLVRDEVCRQRALRQERVGGDIPAGDVAAREERDRGADFVGALELIASGYGQGADFFWV